MHIGSTEFASISLKSAGGGLRGISDGLGLRIGLRCALRKRILNRNGAHAYINFDLGEKHAAKVRVSHESVPRLAQKRAVDRNERPRKSKVRSWRTSRCHQRTRQRCENAKRQSETKTGVLDESNKRSKRTSKPNATEVQGASHAPTKVGYVPIRSNHQSFPSVRGSRAPHPQTRPAASEKPANSQPADCGIRIHDRGLMRICARVSTARLTHFHIPMVKCAAGGLRGKSAVQSAPTTQAKASLTDPSSLAC